MNEKQYKDLKETFPYVEKLSAKARHAYFERLYPDDSALRKEAAALFETHENEMASRAFRDLSSSQDISNQKEDTDFVDIDFDGFRKYKFGPEDLLGRGGMGVVFKALDIDLDRYVAIKLLPTNLADDPERKKRFEVEARTLVNLSHPYILKVFDFGQAEDGSFYMVSELVEGRPLNEFIKTGGTNLKEKLYIARYVGEAISAGHKQGVIHRDIKPNNILLRKDGYPVVLDFGLAKLLENHDFRNIPDSRVVTSPLVVTDRRMIVGTPAYMSPEQASRRKLDERTDIFSFGIVLYELFTGKHPFTGLTDFEINAAIQKDEPLPIENDHIPDDLQAVIKKAIRKDLSKRYQSMEHLLEDLRSIGETEDTLRLFMPESDEDPRIPDTDPQADGQTAEDATVQTERGSLWKTVTAKNVVRKLRAHTWLMVLVLAVATSIVAGAYYLASRTFEPTPAALAWYEKGREAFKHGDFLSAKTNFEKAVGTDKNYALAQMSLAEALNETGDFDGAKSARQIAIEKNQQAELPLDHRDSVRFEAISKTIQRDFLGALRAYETLAGNAAGPEKAEAQLLVGRAYETEFLLDKALRSYRTALSIDKELPYPQLLLADIYARRMDTKTALQNYDASADLYRKRQDLQGEIEAIFRRGLHYQKVGREKDAIEDLQEANQKARDAGLSFQTGRTYYLLARIARGSSKLDSALRYLDEAEDVARRNSFTRMLFDIASERGTVYLFKADLGNARRHCNEALKLAEESKITLDIMRAHLLLANFYSQFHQIDELSWAKSAEHLSKAENFFEKGRYQKDLMLLLSIRRRDLTAQGKPKEALKIARRLEKEAGKTGDKLDLARAKKDIGTNLALFDQLPEAMEFLYESYSIYNSLNKPIEAGYSLLARGDVALQMGDFEKAKSTLEIAKGIAQETTEWLPPRVDLFEARILTAERRFEDAVEVTRKMIREDDSGQLPSTFEARAMLALALTHLNRSSEGLREIESLFSDKLPERDDPEAAVASYLLYAEVLLENGKPGKSKLQAEQANDILKTLEKPSLEWRARVLEARAHQKLGNSDESQKLAAKADMLFSGLSEKWGKKNFENYSNSQSTQHYRNAGRD